MKATIYLLLTGVCMAMSCYAMINSMPVIFILFMFLSLVGAFIVSTAEQDERRRAELKKRYEARMSEESKAV